MLDVAVLFRPEHPVQVENILPIPEKQQQWNQWHHSSVGSPKKIFYSALQQSSTDPRPRDGMVLRWPEPPRVSPWPTVGIGVACFMDVLLEHRDSSTHNELHLNFQGLRLLSSNINFAILNHILKQSILCMCVYRLPKRCSSFNADFFFFLSNALNHPH